MRKLNTEVRHKLTRECKWYTFGINLKPFWNTKQNTLNAISRTILLINIKWLQYGCVTILCLTFDKCRFVKTCLKKRIIVETGHWPNCHECWQFKILKVKRHFNVFHHYNNVYAPPPTVHCLLPPPSFLGRVSLSLWLRDIKGISELPLICIR